jgi:ubiquinone biosynthesis monooxygenase Coq7
MKEVERILKLDQAGEYGAIQIYSAQLLLARLRYKDIISQLEEMISHEKEHYKTFNNLLLARGMSPFRVIRLWAAGGFVLGIVTAILGRKAIWICTDAVETTVLHHLEWQLDFLSKHDLEAHSAVLSIVADEKAHQEFGQKHSENSFLHAPIFFIVRKSTEFAIWVSTKL